MAEPRAFVCGYPIKHSRSPLIHGHWLKTYGLTGSYVPVEVSPENFSGFIASLREQGFAGGNVTIPHKEVVARLAEKVTAEAGEIGAVNTLWFEDGVLNGTNTDAYGFAANLDQQAPGWDKARSAVVIGAGGAARAVVHALVTRGFTDIRVMNRTVERARELADRFGKAVTAHGLDGQSELLSGVGLAVNTTALGMEGEGALPADPALLSPGTLVTDIVYVPLETPFLAAARQCGLQTVDGLGMLLHQAAPGFERWFGVMPDVTPELRELIVADLDRH